MTSVLEVENVSVSYGSNRVLHDVSLSVGQGQCAAIVGESGSGKSTLARAVMGIKVPSAGRVLVDGKPVAGVGLRSAQMIFQDPIASLNPRRQLADVIAEPLDIRQIGTRAERRERARALLARVGLDPEIYATRSAREVSGGQAQRIAIARALAAEPTLLVCDEPVSALDVSVQAVVLNLLADLRDEHGLTMLFISHDIAVVRMIADTISVIHQGSIVESRPTEELIHDPHSSYTRELLDAAPRFAR